MGNLDDDVNVSNKVQRSTYINKTLKRPKGKKKEANPHMHYSKCTLDMIIITVLALKADLCPGT